MGSHETAAIHSSDIVLTSFSLANRITDKNIILDFGGLIDWMMIEACLSIQTQVSTADNFFAKTQSMQIVRLTSFSVLSLRRCQGFFVAENKILSCSSLM